MKFLFLLLINISVLSFSQSFQPFKEDVPKRFHELNNPSQADYFFYSIKTDTLGDSIIFNQYFRNGLTEVEILCPNWGGGWSPTGDTTWLGRTIIYDTLLQTLELTNDSASQLLFDFSIPLGDSALFYSDASNDYFMVHTSLSQETILGSLDWVKTYEIHHYDNLGSTINSNLHGFEIKLGDTLGLINFIDCKNFPYQETGVSLMGQLHPTIGTYQMTYDDAFPWDVGDELGYVGYHYSPQEFYQNKHYRILKVTDRIETTDSVNIYFDYTDSLVNTTPNFQGPGFYNIHYYSPISFKKGQNISEYPSGMMAIFDDFNISDSIDDCGLRARLTYTTSFEFYCDSSQNMAPYDGFGSVLVGRTYKSGLGKTSSHPIYYGPPQDHPSQSGYLSYSIIDGVVCGSQFFLSQEELDVIQFQLYPNPAKTQVTIQSTVQGEEIILLDMQGKILRSIMPTSTQVIMDVSDLDAGIYFVQLRSQNNAGLHKLVIE
ncbi:MAG: T9SS type A sorting domain-containing protein [Crocinitomicaceae bacterium]